MFNRDEPDIARDGAKLIVFGSFNVDEKPFNQIVNSYTTDLIKPAGRVTYRTMGKNWAVASGEDGRGSIFYSKTIKRSDEVATFQLIYPRRLAARYAPIATHLSECLAHITVESR